MNLAYDLTRRLTEYLREGVVFTTAGDFIDELNKDILEPTQVIYAELVYFSVCFQLVIATKEDRLSIYFANVCLASIAWSSTSAVCDQISKVLRQGWDIFSMYQHYRYILVSDQAGGNL